MSSSKTQRADRALRAAAAALAGVAVVWSVAWLAGAEWIGRRIDGALAAAAASGTPIVCRNRSLGGFPFRISVTCDRFGVQMQAGERSVSLGRAEATALAIRPGRVTAALATPASAAWDGTPVTLDWRSAMVDINLSGPAESSVRFDAFRLGIADIGVSSTATTASLGPDTADGGWDIALASDETVIATPGQNSAPFRLTLAADVSVPPDVLPADSLEPTWPGLDVPRFTVRAEAPPAAVEIAGALSAGLDGLADGAFTLTLVDPDGLYDWLATLPQDLADMGSMGLGLAGFMGEPVDVDGAPGLRLHFTIKDGQMALGGSSAGQTSPVN